LKKEKSYFCEIRAKKVRSKMGNAKVVAQKRRASMAAHTYIHV